MSEIERREGMDWITIQLLAIATEEQRTFEIVGWHEPSSGDDFKANRRSLVVTTSGERRVLSFSDEDLEDIPADAEVRSYVEDRLRVFVTRGDSGDPHGGVAPDVSWGTEAPGRSE